MMLRNLMEDKRLNLNQPFLSVRRHPSTLILRKDEKRKTNDALHVIPRLPPHRSELKSGPVRNPGAVPFQWEHAPGLPKEDIKPQTQNFEKPPIAPKILPSKYPKGNQQDARKDPPSIRESITETIEQLETSESGNSDEAYVDAGDALKRSESFFLNCSVSGVSGMEDLNADQSGGFSTDIQTREFMMDRFLPAAKAMTSESPQYVPKKQVAREQAQAKKTVNQDKPSLRYGPSFAKRYSCYHDIEEKEESDDGYEQHGNFPAACGLLPRLGLMSSLCVLNQVPGMSVRTRASISPGNNTQTKSSSAGSYSETENESKSDISEQQSASKVRTAELGENKSSLRNENCPLERHNNSMYCNEPLYSHKEREVVGISEETKHSDNNGSGSERKGYKTFRELLADPGSPRNTDAGLIEKTVYVDTVQTVECPNVHDTTGDPGSREEDHGTMVKSTDQVRVIDPCLDDIKKFDKVENRGKLQPNAKKHSEFNVAPSIEKSNKKQEMMERLKAFGENQEIYLVSIAAARVEAPQNEANESLERQLPRRKNSTKLPQKYSDFPVPPPLPKSPSDSWLCRTLPSISAKNAPLRSSNPQNQFNKVSARNVKWENIVKSTNMQNRNLRYSEGKLTSIQET